MDNSKKILKNIQIYHWSYPHYNIVVIAKNRKPILGRDTYYLCELFREVPARRNHEPSDEGRIDPRLGRLGGLASS